MKGGSIPVYKRPQGIIVPVITPYRSEGKKIDYDKLGKHLDFLIKEGVEGIFLLGTNGEAPLLRKAEKESMVKFVTDEFSDRIPIYVGTGYPGFKETLEFSEFVVDQGADYLVICLPYFYSLAQREIKDYFQSLAKRLKFPIIIYNIPVTRGVKLEADTLANLSQIDNIVGLKDSTGDLIKFHEYLETVSDKDDFSVLMGRDGLAFYSLCLGGDGVVSGLSNFCPEIACGILKHFKEGNFQKAMREQERLIEVEDAVLASGYATAVPGIKAALKLKKFDSGGVRRPLLKASRQGIENLEAVLKRMGLV